MGVDALGEVCFLGVSHHALLEAVVHEAAEGRMVQRVRQLFQVHPVHQVPLGGLEVAGGQGEEKAPDLRVAVLGGRGTLVAPRRRRAVFGFLSLHLLLHESS